MTDTIRSSVGGSEVDIKPKSKEKDIPIVHDHGFFIYETGGTYDGYFEAKKKDRSVKMHGPGVYTTAEGDRYSGVWDNDQLGCTENVTISFIDGSKYEGQLKEWCYYGHAKYSYPDGASLQCEFRENSPVGELELTDPNGHTWLGKAEQGYGWFSPVNHFFEMLTRNNVPSKTKRCTKIVKDEFDIPKLSLPEFVTKKSKVVNTSATDVSKGTTPAVNTSKKKSKTSANSITK